jgi:hypothetical protein
VPPGESGGLLATGLRLVGRHVRAVSAVLLLYWFAIAVIAVLLAIRPDAGGIGAASTLAWAGRVLAAPLTGVILIPAFAGRRVTTRKALARVPELVVVYALLLVVA